MYSFGTTINEWEVIGLKKAEKAPITLFRDQEWTI